MLSSIDNKLKSHGYAKISEDEYGVVYVMIEHFGHIELRIYHGSDDTYVECVHVLSNPDGTQQTLPYALSLKILRLADRKIREMRQKYAWN